MNENVRASAHAARLRIIPLIAGLLLPVIVHAAKPPGGGGPAGTVYFSENCPYPNFYNCVAADGMRSMAADGSNKLTLSCASGDPSILLHGGKRWFLQVLGVPGEVNNQGYGRSDLFASREDGLSVRLTDDGGLNWTWPSSDWQWGPDESATTVTVAGLSRRYAPDGSEEPGSGGLYVATLRFDASGLVVGLDAPPQFVMSVGVRPGEELPDASGFSWSPDMTRIVANQVSVPTRLRIIDVPSGIETTLLDDPSRTLRSPEWSPSGQRIAFTTSAVDAFTVDAILATGTGRVTLHLDRKYPLGSPTWSPDSSMLVFQKGRFDNQSLQHLGEVYRVPASGGGATNLTNTSALGETPRGWR